MPLNNWSRNTTPNQYDCSTPCVPVGEHWTNQRLAELRQIWYRHNADNKYDMKIMIEFVRRIDAEFGPRQGAASLHSRIDSLVAKLDAVQFEHNINCEIINRLRPFAEIVKQ